VTPGSASWRALGTTVTLCAADARALGGARTVLEGELVEIDRTCSRFRPDSELVRLNASDGRAVRVGTTLLEAIALALRAAEATGGLVDPTVGRALRLAGYDRTFTLVAARDGRSFRARFAPAPGWEQVEVDVARGTVRLPRGAELDLGATAKALAADRGARAAAEATGSGVLVSLGGDVAVAGEAPGAGWSIRIADDHTAALGSAGPAVSIRAGGLASSGTAVRRWRAGCRELHHILDPRTGRPAETPWRTVSVAAASCVDANVASTAAVVLGAAAPAWLSARRLPARLVTDAGRVVRVANWPDEAA
jgi:thiamine biosynthesis lipoprotein